MSTLLKFPANPYAVDSVAEEVRAVMGRRRISGTELGRMTGKSQAYWWRRLSGETPFDVNDLVTVASILEVTVTSLVAPLDAEGPRPAGPAGASGVVLPQMDSNHQPSVYQHEGEAPAPISLAEARAQRDAASAEAVAL